MGLLLLLFSSVAFHSQCFVSFCAELIIVVVVNITISSYFWTFYLQEFFKNLMDSQFLFGIFAFISTRWLGTALSLPILILRLWLFRLQMHEVILHLLKRAHHGSQILIGIFFFHLKSKPVLKLKLLYLSFLSWERVF